MSLASLWPLIWPVDIVPKQTTFKLVTKESVTNSWYTGAEKIYRYGDYLQWTVTLPPLPEEQAKRFRAFILALQGRSGTFYWSPPEQSNTGSLFLGSATVDLVNRNKILTIAPIVAGNITLRAGDWLWIQDLYQMVMVVSDHPTPASSLTNVMISPGHRFISASGTKSIHAIQTTNSAPIGIFRLESEVPISTELLRIANCSFTIREAF